MVRTPAQKKFNGTLVVEWTNVTVGGDFEFASAEASKYLLREGYAVAVVSAQRVGVERLKTWSPTRYAGLSVDVNACGADGTSGTTGTSLCTGDPLSFDIFTQISQPLKQNAGGSSAPMPGLVVEDVIAIGQSQSASRLQSYYNGVQALSGVINGFAYWDLSNQLRSDLKVPAISAQSEALALLVGPWTTSEFTRGGCRRLDARRWRVATSTRWWRDRSITARATDLFSTPRMRPGHPAASPRWMRAGVQQRDSVRWIRTSTPAAPHQLRTGSRALVRILMAGSRVEFAWPSSPHRQRIRKRHPMERSSRAAFPAGIATTRLRS
jgi:hypothetical protein